MDPTSKTVMEEASPLTDKGRHQRLVGKLIYLANTKLDISFTVGLVNTFVKTPIASIWKQYLQIL